MYKIIKYKFYRSKKDPDLYRYTSSITQAPSLYLEVDRWRPWSKWLTAAEIRKIIKERNRFKDLISGLQSMAPGTIRIQTKIVEEFKQKLFLWNKPEDIGRVRLQKTLTRLRVFGATNSDYVMPISSYDDLVASFRRYEQTNDFSEKLDSLIGIVGKNKLDKDTLKKVRECTSADQALPLLKEKIDEFFNTYRIKADTDMTVKKSSEGDILVCSQKDANKWYKVDPIAKTCTCDSFKKLDSLKLVCKHILHVLKVDDNV